jgi:DNA-binding MarR family transcriptional regulator
MAAADKLVSKARLPIDAPERRRLPLLLRRAWYGLNQAFRRQLAPLGVTPDQFTVMRTLLENEDITQRQLAHLMTSDPNTVASLVERMERQGLVARRTREKDRRANLLRLKQLGKQKYEAASGEAGRDTTADGNSHRSARALAGTLSGTAGCGCQCFTQCSQAGAEERDEFVEGKEVG